MRLRILSDLHVEVAAFEPQPVTADLVVLAGDIHNGVEALRWARQTFPRDEILMVAGNHEFYDGEYLSTLDAMREQARHSGVRLLENEATVIDGVRFLGCTLWTDFRLFEHPGRLLQLSPEQAFDQTRRMIPDFRAIRYARGGLQPVLALSDWTALHAVSRAWLTEELARPWDGPTVVVSHHLPSWRSVHPDFAAFASNVGFASDLDHLVAQATLWIHGHTHTTQRYRVGACEVVCNPRGYPRKPPKHQLTGQVLAERVETALVFENPEFDPQLVVDLAAVRA
ncbi:MAG: metallophosphoesterase [Quisquiliibacterium sp.]